jgi:hypothetical protein
MALCNSLCLSRTKSYLPPHTHTKVMSIKDTGSENSHATQKLLYTTIRRGCEGLGVEIARPEALYDIIPSHMKSQFPPTPPSSASASPLPPLPPSVPPTLRSPTRVPESTDNVGGEVSDGSSLEYDDVTPESLQLSHQSQMPNLHTVSVTRGPTQVDGRLEKKVEELQQQQRESVAEVARLNSRLERNEDREGQLEEELGKVKYSVQKLLPQVFALQSKMTHITSPQRQIPAVMEEEGEEEKESRVNDTMEENKKFLRTLSSHEVCELLQVMELSQYKEVFIKESVSGEILADCDNDILQTDLGVASRLHRLRLMKVISGRHSAASLIEGADPYVILGKK